MVMGKARATKVYNFYLTTTVGFYENVFRFKVAMHKVHVVDIVQSSEYLVSNTL